MSKPRKKSPNAPEQNNTLPSKLDSHVFNSKNLKKIVNIINYHYEFKTKGLKYFD